MDCVGIATGWGYGIPGVEDPGAGGFWCSEALVLGNFGAGKLFGAIPAVHGFGGNPGIENLGAGKVWCWEINSELFLDFCIW